MSARRWLVLVLVVVVLGGAVAIYALPGIARRGAITRLEAMTGRPVAIDALDLSLFTGRVAVRGVRVMERDGTTPFADLRALDARVRVAALLRRHVHLTELTLTEPTVRLVRLAHNQFNASDLLQSSGETGKKLDVTVDRFRVLRGTATLEDRAVPEPQTWRSEHMTIDAHDISTLRNDGRAVGKTLTAGATISLQITDLRLYPIHLRATATVEGLDLTPARVYFPPDAAVRVDNGRMSTTVTLTLDARDGIRADATGSLEDLVLGRPGERMPLARVPKLTGQLSGFALRDGTMRIDRFASDGTMMVRDPTGKTGTALRPSTVRASLADFTWPATTPGQVDVHASIPGGGSLALVGTVRPPPAPTQLSLRLAKVNLAPWAQLVPGAARVTGIAEADLRMNEPFGAGVPARLQGSIAVHQPVVAEARPNEAPQEIVRAQRVEASGIELQWPSRIGITRVVIAAPRAAIAREADGTVRLPLRGADAAPERGAPAAAAKPSAAPALAVTVGEVVVRDGAFAWRDASVKPAARLDVAGVDATVNGAGWPLTGPLTVRAALRPPGGGQLRVSGRVGVEPVSADVRVTATNAELAPYQPYLPTTARVSGAADADLAVVVPSLAERRATARGTAALSRVDVQDGRRTVMRAERATATGIDVAWPERVTVGALALVKPWLLLERDDQGELALRALAPPAARAKPGGQPDGTGNGDGADAEPLAITVGRLSVDDGGVRVVDRAIAPAFAVDVDAATVRVDGLSTAPARPARVDLAARVAGTADLALRGTLGPLAGPLRLDVDGELREFAVPRANSYLIRQIGWKSREGRVTTKLRARLDGDALAAKTDIRVSRLKLMRAGAHDEAQQRIGLPLGMLTALMKDRRGDINVSFPVGGKLSDPKFDFRETIWSAVRTVAVNAITLPVSWIGRVHFTPDSRIERIQVDPLTFEPGTATLTADSQARIPRVKAFLDHLTEVRMAVTPVVSARDVAEMKQRSVQAAVEGLAREARLSREAATLRLHEQRLRRPAPAASYEAALTALVERESTPPPAELAERRLDTVRTAMKQAGVDAARLTETKAEERAGAASQVDLEVLEPEGPRPSKMRDALRRLGIPMKDE